MLKKIASLLAKKTPTVKIVVLRGRQQTTIQCNPGDNLMDVTNSTVNQDANIFGLCDKQLACTTCRVDIEEGYCQVPPPSDEQLDVLLTTANYKPESSRMACQIFISQELEGLVVRIDGGSKPSKS